MKNIYIDNEFKCHTTNPDGALRQYETDFFDGKCDTFVEGYRLIPSGESWTHSDGKVFNGEMTMPFKPYNVLAAAQLQYETDLSEAEAAYQEGVNSAYDQ